MSRDVIQFTGEFRLEEALVTSPTGQVTDLMTDLQIVEINLFESLIRNTISGSIIVVDTRNVVVKLPIVGQEDLSLKIVTPSLKKKEDILDFTENTFFIHKIAKREEVSVGAQTYELSFVSDAAIINSSKRLSRSYVGSKANIGEMVEDILKKDLGVPSDRIFVEPTLGTRKLIIPNSKPYTFITRLTKQALSKQGSPHYLFFENKNGMHFLPLQKLYEQDIRAEFNVNDEGIDQKQAQGTPESYKRMIEYSLNIKKDTLVNASTGMMGSNVIEHNLYNKKYEVKKFNYFDDKDFQAFERIDDNRVYSDDLFGDDIVNSKTHVIPISREDDVDKSHESGTPNQRYKTILNRQSRFIELADGISINMTVHGQTTLTVGDMVDVTIPPLAGNEREEGPDKPEKFYSGLYLIKTLRHTFSPPTRNHIISMEVFKDGFPDAI